MSPVSAAVTVVVVTYSPGETLAAFLDSLKAATSRTVEVIVVDNGSTDGAPERAAERVGVRLIRTGDNLGYGGAANRGLADATTDWVVVANPDIVWQPGSLDVLVDATDLWPYAAALGPAIVTTTGELYPSARALPSLSTGIGHALFGWAWPSNPWTQRYRRENEPPVEGETGWLSGSCLLLRRVAVDRIGGFDPAYFMYFEDVDLCDRLEQAGWQVVYLPASVVEHLGGHATSQRPVEMLVAHHRSAYRYLARHYRGWRWLPVRLTIRLGLRARLALSRLSGRVEEGAAPQRSADALDAVDHTPSGPVPTVPDLTDHHR